MGEAALDLLEGVAELHIARGRKTIHVELGDDRPSDEALLGLLLGRSGKLRAPAIRVGAKLLIGYNADLLSEQLG